MALEDVINSAQLWKARDNATRISSDCCEAAAPWPSAEQASNDVIVNPNPRGCYGEESQEGKEGSEENDREKSQKGEESQEEVTRRILRLTWLGRSHPPGHHFDLIFIPLEAVSGLLKEKRSGT